MKIGLIAAAMKPYHAGHHCLVNLASQDNDRVVLFVSTGDRKRKGEVPILGKDMLTIWLSFIEKSLPGNVEVRYVPGPVTSLYEFLSELDQKDFTRSITIYSGDDDTKNYKTHFLQSAAPSLFKKGQIVCKGIDRNSTVNVSGTKMREFLRAKNAEDKLAFISFLPKTLQRHGAEIYDVLSRNVR
jgi:hypothetical protein